MSPDQFLALWDARFHGVSMVPHCFRHDLPTRWFRVHSLPDSQRYAADQVEWALLLERQNKVLTDILGEGADILLVTGDHYAQGQFAADLWPDVDALEGIDFTALPGIDLHLLDPDLFVDGWTYQPKYAQQVWQAGAFNSLLRAIADDLGRAYFISLQTGALAAPYDGGIDFVMPDQQARDRAKQNYKAWISKRPDGL